MKNMKIGRRLIVCCILVSIVASISGFTMIFAMKSMDNSYNQALKECGFVQGDIGKAMLPFTENMRCIRDVLTLDDQAAVSKAKKQIEENRALYQQYSATVEASISTDEERSIYDNITRLVANYTSKRDEILNIAETGDDAERSRAVQMAIDELDPLYDEVYNAWMSFMDAKVADGNAVSRRLQNTATFLNIFTLGLIVVAIVIAVVFGKYMAHQIADPIAQCVDRLGKLAKGDLKSPVPHSDSENETGVLLRELGDTVNALSGMINDMGYMLGELSEGNLTAKSRATDLYVGEFERLLDSMNLLQQNLDVTMGQIQQSSDQVANGADQVASGAQALSQGATEQASSVEELAATINEISNHINMTAKHAETAKEENINSSKQTQICGDQMQSLVSAMGVINEKSNEISKIIKTIEDIAFQTNILALNAAVEAARAGAAGKGFAVVADEVRNLASKSAEAAKITGTLIGETVSAVADGTRLSEETAASLSKVVEDSKIVLDAVSQISQATGEQAESASQVTQGIDQISSVVQTNSATAEQSAAASQELSGQAQLLKNLLSKFKLSGNVDGNFGSNTSASSYDEPGRSDGYSSYDNYDYGDSSSSGFSGSKY